MAVLEEAVKRHGKPAPILTDHGSQFYANESKARKRGESEYEKKLVEMGIRQILARINHPQTNGKLERFHGELQRKLHRFKDVAGPPGTAAPFGSEPPEADPVARFVKNYNYRRPYMSLDWDNPETPYQAFQRKMPPPRSHRSKMIEMASHPKLKSYHAYSGVETGCGAVKREILGSMTNGPCWSGGG